MVRKTQRELFYKNAKSRLNRGLCMLKRTQQEIKSDMVTKITRNSLKSAQKDSLLRLLDHRLASARARYDENLVDHLLKEKQYINTHYA